MRNKSSYNGLVPSVLVMDVNTERAAIESETRESSRFVVLLGLLLMTVAPSSSGVLTFTTVAADVISTNFRSAPRLASAS